MTVQGDEREFILGQSVYHFAPNTPPPEASCGFSPALLLIVTAQAEQAIWTDGLIVS